MLAVISSLVSFLIVLLLSINSLAFEVSCKDQQDCNPSVAALFIPIPERESNITGNFTDYCSAFLISTNKDESLVLTNSHCIYGRFGGNISVTRKGQTCFGVKVVFPEAPGYNTEAADCRRIVELPDYSPHANVGLPDFAVLAISPIKRPVIPVSKNGVVDGEIHKSIAYDFTIIDKNTSFEQALAIQRTESHCEVDMGNEATPFKSGLAPVVTYKNCRLIPGNSGSVLINARGEAATLAMAMNKLSRQKTFDGQIFLDSGTATNLACIDYILDKETRKEYIEGCDLQAFYHNQGSFINVMKARMDQKIITEVNPAKLMEATIEQNSYFSQITYQKSFEYFKTDVTYQRDWAPQIMCVNKKSLYLNPVNFGKSSFAITADSYRAAGAYNKDYRFVVTEARVVPTTYYINVLTPKEQLAFRNDVKVEVKTVRDGKLKTTETATFPFCK